MFGNVIRNWLPESTLLAITLQVFYNYCSSLGIVVEHLVPHVHTQNGVAESMIKRFQLISGTLQMLSKLPFSSWGHVVVLASMLMRLGPAAYHQYSLSQLISGLQPNISHLRKCGCVVRVAIPPPKLTRMGRHCRLGIYVGYYSPSII